MKWILIISPLINLVKKRKTTTISLLKTLVPPLRINAKDVQEITAKQDLSPRGMKQSQPTTQQTTTSTFATSSRPITTSKSKDSNPNGKKWLFWSNEITSHILENHEQYITRNFKHPDLTEQFMMSFIYAKCKDHMRRPLCDRLLFYASMHVPYCTIANFNLITSIEEKLWGMPYNMNKSFEFISVIEACGLIDLGYTGLPFAWCNRRDTQATVWKRLDRSMSPADGTD
ncbi:hypothetical protein KY290_012911 [Solanum tuberosum]|uniref:Ulp1 protease family, C-terminal catalytic domain containing protein n=1 Tax=Solanum tuberosum TaxID=4113 RepID=A0ABQ7VMG1_SOLTU|nr:hypothetical protein KY285_012682 [Solanum tuberosum]KAH0768930.1 hypothetical protein KY290_012911 [Solanum tuberosum]